MELNEKVRELVAIGASVTANCQPCLQFHMEKAVKAGATPGEVTAAIEMGTRVRKGAAAKMESFAATLQTNPSQGFEVVLEGNGCQYLGP